MTFEQALEVFPMVCANLNVWKSPDATKFSRGAQNFAPIRLRKLPAVECVGDQGWLLSGLKLLSNRSSQLAMATCTEHLRLSYSSMSIWKLSCISFMRLFVQPTLDVRAS